jgi:hypothetical protein
MVSVAEFKHLSAVKKRCGSARPSDQPNAM